MSRRIVFISNIVLEPYLKLYISKSLLSSAVHLDCVSYEEITENQIVIQESDLIVVCLDFDAFYPNALTDISSKELSSDYITRDAITRCRELYDSVKACSNAPIIWFGFEDYYTNSYIVFGNLPVLDGLVDKVNQAIREMMRDDVFVDLKCLIAKIGISNSFSIKGRYRWNAPYSKELVELMSDEVYKQYLVHTGKTKKCVVLDCDNVLWGGILSEDGIEGIHLGDSGLGREYQDFQRFLLNLYYHGVILTVCSKNDEFDVLRVFREHSGMMLREEHIACFKVNWNNKPTNIQKIADELNVSTDSMVFVDDSIFELEAVKSVLPEVTAIQYDRETMYDKFSCFNLKSQVNLTDVKNRNATYRTNRSRAKLWQNCKSYEDYIKSLDTKVDIHKLLPTEYSRIAELTQRTNKCTNGKRYTTSEIKERVNIPGNSFYSVSVSDRFSDFGVVGVIEIETDILKLFSLSCRALGREVENEMVNFVSKRHNTTNIEFKSTEKNEPLRNFLQKSLPDANFQLNE